MGMALGGRDLGGGGMVSGAKCLGKGRVTSEQPVLEGGKGGGVGGRELTAGGGGLVEQNA